VIFQRAAEFYIRANQRSKQQRLSAAESEQIECMFQDLATADASVRPSRYWEELNKMNLAQLAEQGFDKFKRTIALNYFTWARILPWDSQIVGLVRRLGPAPSARAIRQAVSFAREGDLPTLQAFSYGLLTSLLWEYVVQAVSSRELLALEEPTIGSPLLISSGLGRRVSQDLGNSILEYESFGSFIPPGGTVLELGGGYGRNAYVVLSLRRDVRYIMADIPPALWVAEQYLTRVFPDRKPFRYRKMNSTGDISDLFSAEMGFLLTNQLGLLAPQSVDMIVNISSLQEMRPEQINFYLGEFDRLLKPGGHVYIKEWKRAAVLFENITLSEHDYPIPKGWRSVMRRTSPIQDRFFEALYVRG
jgi:putative sugar O-methyltransferase